MVLDGFLVNTQHYKVRIKSSGVIRVKEYLSLSLSLSLFLSLSLSLQHFRRVAFEKIAFRSPSTTFAVFTYYISTSEYIWLFDHLCAHARGCVCVILAKQKKKKLSGILEQYTRMALSQRIK